MNLITINSDLCTGCGLCAKDCTNDVLFQRDKSCPEVTAAENCIDCGHCIAVCPNNALEHSRLDLRNSNPAKHNGIGADEMESFLTSRRSIRQYSTQPVGKAVLERLLNVANMAPTAKNCQERGFIVVSDPEKLQEINDALLKNNDKVSFWLKLMTGRVLSKLLDSEVVEALKKILRGFGITRQKAQRGEDAIFHRAPCVIFIYGIARDPLGKDNCLSAQQYLMAQAHSMGLGTCIVGYAQAAPGVVSRFLEVPKFYKIYGAVTLGYPKTKYFRTTDRKPPQISWVGEFKNSKMAKAS